MIARPEETCDKRMHVGWWSTVERTHHQRLEDHAYYRKIRQWRIAETNLVISSLFQVKR
jgi:hypothetical protein